jgi:hypothetical protein
MLLALSHAMRNNHSVGSGLGNILDDQPDDCTTLGTPEIPGHHLSQSSALGIQ